MISTRWIEKRKPYWSQLETLLAGRSNSLRTLTRGELQELGLLYRQTAADLAAIRQDPSSVHFARYLNQLMARAHNIIYAGHRENYGAILSFFYRDYPAAFRRNLKYCIASVLIFIVGGIAGAAITFQDPDFQTEILGPQMVETIQHREMWTHSIISVKPVASSAIMTNNLTVSFMTFASGITAGLGTLYMLFFNGFLMGVIGAACFIAGMSLKLWSFVAPHGVLELPAIFIAGGAGLKIAQGLLFPGVLPRKESLTLAGKEATTLVLGVIPLLIVAGVIEAFVSPTGIAVALKFSLAAGLFTLLVSYLFGLSTTSAKVGTGAS
ncbi:MAG TPA: stage II sporulation protein M [Terriglobales bacterium]|nr:stage II sporulation protein M [Terriglobales bacterium]